MQRAQRILLVEDEALIALAESTMLERHGFDVTTAATGEDAVKVAAASTAIDLILMDINLGDGMSGTVAAETILKSREIPLIFLSSHTEPRIVESTEGITSYGYVVKNAGETVILASIRMAFRLFEAKEAARNSEKRYRTTLAALDVGIFERDIAAGTLYLSPSYFTMLGYEPDEMPQTVTTYERLVHPEDLRRLQLQMGRLAEGDVAVQEVELRMKRKSGEWTWVRSRGEVVERDARGRPTRFLGTNVKIDTLKRTMEALKAERELLDHYLRVAGVMLIRLDRTMRITSINEEGCRILGCSREEIVGANWLDRFIPESIRTEIAAVAENIFRGAETMVEDYENRVLRPDGSERLIRWHNSTETDDDGNTIGILCSGTDITEWHEHASLHRVAAHRYRRPAPFTERSAPWSFPRPGLTRNAFPIASDSGARTGAGGRRKSRSAGGGTRRTRSNSRHTRQRRHPRTPAGAYRPGPETNGRG